MTTRPSPRPRAAALRYEPGTDPAPRVVAKGVGHMADRILDLARREGIPIHQDRALVDVLARLDLEEEIPPQLYRVVAEIIAFVFRLEQVAATASARPPSGTPGR